MSAGDVVWTALVALSGALWVFVVIALARMRGQNPRLSEFTGAEPADGAWPRLSVIVPARNEEAGVEAASRSLLALDYPELEIIAVDDRSTDQTGAILERLAAEDARLTVVHVKELPAGWLGKNHACHVAARRATGEWLLFTDADVSFEPAALRRAMAACLRLGVGHLVAFPRMLTSGAWERAFQATFAIKLALKLRTWELSRPRTRAFVGAGAFNLVRAEDYRRVGGHKTLRLEVIDDVKLGLVLRRSGVAQAAVDAEGLVRVRWQDGFRASLGGLMKNAFAGCEWRWGMVVHAAGGIAMLSLVPVLAAAFAPTPLALIAGVILVGSMSVHGTVARTAFSGTGLEGLFYPFCGSLLIGVLLASALRATIRGRVRWRETEYPLADLRAGCVREPDWPVETAVGWPER